MKLKSTLMALLACGAFAVANVAYVPAAFAEEEYLEMSQEDYDSLEDGEIVVDQYGNEYEVEVEYVDDDE